MLVLESRDVVSSVDPDGSRCVFMGCPCGVVYSDEHDSRCENDYGHDDVDEHEDEWTDFDSQYRSRWS